MEATLPPDAASHAMCSGELARALRFCDVRLDQA